MNKKSKIAVGTVGVAAAGLLALMMIQEPEPLPMYAYEGETILGYDIPPRLYVLIEQNTHRSKLDNPECKPAAWNFPCVVYKNGETVKLHVFRCVAWQADRAVLVSFDQQSCARQREFDESFVKR